MAKAIDEFNSLKAGMYEVTPVTLKLVFTAASDEKDKGDKGDKAPRRKGRQRPRRPARTAPSR